MTDNVADDLPLELSTDRLLLRDLSEGDTATIVPYFGEPQAQSSILAWQRDPEKVAWHLKSAALYNGHYAWRMRESFAFAACLRENGALIGFVTLYDAIPRGRDARIGWHFGSIHSGRGLATEAASEALRFAFETIEVERMFGDCNESNEASVRIFTKLGMLPCERGFLQRRIRAWRYGQPVPVARFAMDRGSWTARTRST